MIQLRTQKRCPVKSSIQFTHMCVFAVIAKFQLFVF
jgi:hypothetical protein